MFDRNTTLHSAYTTITCPCTQCQNRRNEVTMILPLFEQPISTDTLFATERFVAIDSETGQKVVTYWPIRLHRCCK